MAVRLTPRPAAAAARKNQHGWLRRYVFDQLELMRMNNPHVPLPQQITVSGIGDSEAYISYNRNVVRDLVLAHFEYDELLTADIW